MTAYSGLEIILTETDFCNFLFFSIKKTTTKHNNKNNKTKKQKTKPNHKTHQVEHRIMLFIFLEGIKKRSICDFSRGIISIADTWVPMNFSEMTSGHRGHFSKKHALKSHLFPFILVLQLCTVFRHYKKLVFTVLIKGTYDSYPYHSLS